MEADDDNIKKDLCDSRHIPEDGGVRPKTDRKKHARPVVSADGDEEDLRKELLEKYKDDKRDDFKFFSQSSSIFSHWYRAKFTVDDVQYNCAEQYMMQQKALLMKDTVVAEIIMALDEPGEQRALGRQVRNWDQKLWDENRLAIVKRGNIAKFRQNEELMKELISTYPRTLVVAHSWDTVWGIGLHANDQRAHNRARWRGKNLLGYIITEIRDELMKEHENIDVTPSQEENTGSEKTEEEESGPEENRDLAKIEDLIVLEKELIERCTSLEIPDDQLKIIHNVIKEEFQKAKQESPTPLSLTIHTPTPCANHISRLAVYLKKKRVAVDKLQQLKRGMHIGYMHLLYNHHAIVVNVDASNGTYEIIHFTGTVKGFLGGDVSRSTPRTTSIRKEPLEFDCKDKIIRYDYSVPGYDLNSLDISAEAIVQRAEKYLKERPNHFKQYNMITNNCEHFAAACVVQLKYCKKLKRTGTPYDLAQSQQVNTS